MHPREQMKELGDRIALQAAHLDAAMFRLLTDLREFDAKGYWYTEGAKSCAHWLSWRVSWDLATAREHVRVARRLGELPKVGAALERAELSYSKVRAITRVASAKTEDTLLLYARKTTAAQLEKICRQFRTVQRLDAKGADVNRDRRHVARRDLDDGMVRIEAVLRPEEAAVFWAAIERSARDVSAERFDRADGLMAIAEREARGERSERAPIEVIVTVPRAALTGDATANPLDQVGCFVDDGHVSAEGARRLACDCGIVEVELDEHQRPLSVGRKTRTIPASIKRALLCRDQTCRYPGCTNRLFVQGHHIEHWANGGETSLHNLVTLCSYHHVFVHEAGVRVELDAEQQPIFSSKYGARISAVPARPWMTATAWQAIEEANRALAITPQTGQCEWDGWPVDYERAVDGLWRADATMQP